MHPQQPQPPTAGEGAAGTAPAQTALSREPSSSRNAASPGLGTAASSCPGSTSPSASPSPCSLAKRTKTCGDRRVRGCDPPAPPPHPLVLLRHLVEGGLGHGIVLDAAGAAVGRQDAEDVGQGAAAGGQAVVQGAPVPLLQHRTGHAALHQALHRPRRGPGASHPHHHRVAIPKPASETGTELQGPVPAPRRGHPPSAPPRTCS